MPILTKNMDLASPLKLNAFRKIALGTWRTVGDPSVYSFYDADVGPALEYIEKLRRSTGQKITLTHFIGKVIGQVISEHRDLNCILRWGRIYPRRTVDVFFQIAGGHNLEDLSGTTIRDVDRKTIPELAREMEAKVYDIREKGDPAFRQMKGAMKLLPGWATYWAIHLAGFIMYGLNLWSPILGTPRDPFGSVMVTSIGSLGLDSALAPLVPYSRVPVLVVIGSVRETPVVKDGKITIAKICRLGITFDHRMIDGIHASRMTVTLRKLLENPEKELGPQTNA